MNIRQTIFDYVCARQPRRTATFPDWEHVSSVMVLYESEWQERNSEIKAIIRRMKDHGKQVVSWGYIQKDKVTSANLPDSRVLGAKDCNLLHKPKAEVVQDLQRREFDLLIDLTTKPMLPLQYVAMLANARFKIGAYDLPTYDMTIQCDASADSDYLFGQIEHYLSSIKSADK